MSIPQTPCRRGHNSTRNASGACRQCAKENKDKYLKANPGYHLTWYKKNADKTRKKNLVYTRKRYQETAQWIQSIKAELGCSTCPEKDIRCLDFHHVNPQEKSFNISDGFTYSRVKLEAELKKCIVLCSNCHRKLEAPE